jgi:WD repeat-containing protein 55
MKPTQTYPDAHIDHITSFLPLPSINPHQVLATSGDCTLSIFDVRKAKVVATSEDQEDELLCCAFGDDSRRICVGTQSGFITVWKTGEWMDHVDRISPLGKVRMGDEPANVDCIVQMEDKVIVGLSDGWLRTVEFRPNRYGDAVGQCEEGVTCLSVVPQEKGWVVSASAATVKFWDTNMEENAEEEEDDESDSSEEEKPAKKRKTGKNKGNGKASSSAFFSEL